MERINYRESYVPRVKSEGITVLPPF